jgi:hypothetical protein
MRIIFYVFILICFGLSTKAQINTAEEKFALPDTLDESSGAIFFNGKLIAHNDSGGENKLFELDTISGSITRTVTISNATNVDWEDVTQDEDFIYVGDIGNNNGNRTDLKIYKIDKSDYLNATTVTAQTIDFDYANQSDFTSNPNNTEWDAEALISIDQNNLVLFSKNWVNNQSSAYLIPKSPGTYSISPMATTYNSGGLITGGTYNTTTEKLFLVGYQPISAGFSALEAFVSISENFTSDDIFSGTNTQFYLSAFGQEQAEAITYVNTNRYLITSESFSFTQLGFTFSDYGKLIAFNEIPLGGATQISILNQPAQQECDGSLASPLEVQLEDENGNAVNLSGFTITASLDSGLGTLQGTSSKTTDSSGKALFDDLEFSVNDAHTIRFTFPGLNDAVSSEIGEASGCNLVQWTGQVNSDWSNIANWTPQEIPDENYEVIIPNDSPNYPVLDVDAGVGDFTMANNASIDLNGFTLNLSGSLDAIDNAAQIDASSSGSELYLSASIPQVILSDILNPEVAKLTVENGFGVTLNSEIHITEVLNIKQGTLTTNDNLTLACSFSPRQTAQIDELGGSLSGLVTVEQCYTPRRSFRLVSPSTTTTSSINANWQEGVNNTGLNYPSDNLNPNPGYGTHITGSISGNNGFDATATGNPSLFSFDEATQTWNSLNNTDSNTLTAGNPLRLIIRGDRSINLNSNSATPTSTKLRSNGLIVNGPISPDLSSLGSNVKFALLGNPFHAVVDMDMVLSESVDLKQHFVVWDPNLGGISTPGQPGGRGAYVTVNVFNNTNTNSDSDMNNYLQPYQAFFVEAQDDSPQLVFQEEHKIVDGNQLDVFNDTTTPQHINIRLYDETSYNNANTSDDGLKISFSSNFSNALNNRDATKFLNIDENIARIENDIYLSYEERALPTENDSLQLYTDQYRDTDYVFEVEVGDFPDNKVFLLDNYSTGDQILLNEESLNTYSFSVDPSIAGSIADDRFKILFEDDTFSTSEFDQIDFKIIPNPIDNNQFTIINANLKDKSVDVSLSDIVGKTVFQQRFEKFEGSQKVQPNIQLSSGIYFLQLSNSHMKSTKKLIVE